MKMSKVTGFVREAAAMRIADVTRQHKKEGREESASVADHSTNADWPRDAGLENDWLEITPE
jgi:hypothetical protein